MNKDSELEEGRVRILLRNGAEWIFLILSLGYGAWELYLRHTEGTFALEPLYRYLFVEHHAISMPIIVVTMVTALLFDRIRTQRDPETKLRLFWKVVAFFAIVLAAYFAINGIQLAA